MSERRILISVAHPDDETFGYGGLVAKYVAEGVDVFAIVSTDGDAGTMDAEFIERHGSVRATRLAELDCAERMLGFRSLYRLGYRDSGMMNSETSRHPDCSWQAPREELTRRVVEVIRETRPQIILTHNRYGGYGHPDHIAIQRATSDAFHRAGEPGYADCDLKPWQAQNLYYSASPTLLLRYGILMMRLRGRDPRAAGRNHDIDMIAVLENSEKTHTLVDVRDWLEIWHRANRCHASQMTGRRSRPPAWLQRLFQGRQRFTRVHPRPPRDRIDEHDLFENVRVGDYSPAASGA